MPAGKRENGSVEASTSRGLAQGGKRATLEHAEDMSYYVGNISAEMATVLRNDAIMLTRLREKMGVTN